MQQIQDQHKLFQKLFISPTTTSHNPHLILSMQFLKLLLQEAPQLAPAALKHLLLKILGLFEVQPVNSLLLHHHDSLGTSQTPLLTEIVLACAQNVSSRQEGEQYLTMMDSLLAFYPLTLLHVTSITRQFAFQFHRGRFLPLKSWFLHQVLEKYYGPKKGLKGMPQSFFFFYGCSQVSTIHSFEQIRVQIKQELGIMFRFYLIDKAEEDFVICRVKTNKESLIVKVGKTVTVENETTGQKMVEAQSIKPEQWTKVIINMNINETVIYLNDEQIGRQRALIKKEKDRELIQYSFGEQLVGFMTGIAIAHRVIPVDIVKAMPDVKDWNQIRFVRKTHLQDVFLLCCMPFSTFEMRGVTHCFDMFQKIHSQIGQNIVLFKSVSQTVGSMCMGGPEILLPLFYLARFYDSKEYPDQLECLLQIWLSSMNLFAVHERFQQFLLIIGHHLEALPEFLTPNCVTILGLIYDKYSLTNKTHFLRYVAWCGLPAKTSGAATTEWLRWLTKLYQNNKSHCLQAYGLLDVVYWLVVHLENNLHYCCPQHYLSEARILRQFSLQEMSRIQKDSKRLHFEAVQNIAAVILQYYLIDHHQKTQKKLKGILRLLLHKYSACLYRTILRIFKRQFPKFKDDRALCLFFLDAELVPFLAALAQKTVDASLLALIVYLLLMVSNYREGGRPFAIDYLSIVFKRMESICQQHFNPVTHGVKKIRKRSDGAKQSHGYTDLISKMNQYRQDMSEVATILLNFALGTVSEKDLIKEGRLSGDEPLRLLRYFMPIAGTETRVRILGVLGSKIEQFEVNMQWCLQSIQFNQLILWGVRDAKSKEAQKSKQIISKCIRWHLKKKLKITQYYILLKTLAKSQIDLTSLICEVFLNIEEQNDSLTLDDLQMFMLIVNAEYKHLEYCNCSYFWKFATVTSTKVFNLLNHNLNINENMNCKHLLSKLEKLPTASLAIGLFGLEMNVIAQEDITFLFDICLPKAAAGCNVEGLFQETKRRVYAFQILVWSFLQLAPQNQEQSKVVIKRLVWILKVFLSISLLKSQFLIDKSFVRMVIFIVSHTLCFSNYNQDFVDLWIWILQLTKDQALSLKVSSYSELILELLNVKIQPYLAQLFEIFLRPSNEEYLLPFDKLLASDEDKLKQFMEGPLTKMISLPSMAYAVSQCKQYAFKELAMMFSERIRTMREQLDSQQKKGPEMELVRAVEKLFQQESVGEQQTRVRYLHDYQCSLRQYFSSWKKLWKKLRIYHHPYGLFMAQKDSTNMFEFKEVQNKNIRYKISKFRSDSMLHPILQAQVLQPWHVRKTIKRDAKNELSFLVEMARPSHQARNKKQGLGEMATNFFNALRGQKKIQQAAEYQVIWIKRGRKAGGKLLVSENCELIFWYDSIKQEDSHLSFERFSLPFDKPMIKKWRVDLIRKISLRRYLMQWHALQIELMHKKSLLFYFSQHRQKHFLSQIQAIRASRFQQYGSKLKLNKVPLYMQGWYSQQMEYKLTQDWLNRKMSTLSYLLAVNKAASRGILDMSQYPVVPWVCQMTEEKQPAIRDLSKSMGALGSEERKIIAKEKYNSKDPFNPVPSFFFGTHYSSPGVVFNYLIRVAPFTDYCKNLQGGKFDIPDRLFASLLTAWRSASSQVSDVRQMIPQFYYLPECLLNLQKLHLGLTQCGEEVNNVELPPWGGDSPYYLVAQMRQMLQSDLVSSQISKWIDFIFGYKQRGKEAIDNFNVYYYLTYEDYSSCLDNEHDQIYRKSCEAQIVHFGQIPPQLFDQPHPARKISAKPPPQVVINESIDLTYSLSERPIGILKKASQFVIIRRNEIHSFVAGKSPAIMTRSVDFNLERTISKKMFNLKKQCARTVFFKKYFLIYGYVTNEIRIFSRTSGAIEFDDQMDSKVEYVICNKEETLLLVGCHSGLLHIYELEYDHKLLPKRVSSLAFPYSIYHISEHDGFFAITFGCYVSIYKIQRPLSFLSNQPQQPFIRFFRSFSNPLPIRAAFISDSPLYSLLFYDNAHVKVYSINGQLIKSASWTVKGIQRMVDSQLHSLFCIHEEGRLMLVSTPDLRCLSQMEIGNAMQVSEGVIVYKNKLLFIDCKGE